MTELTRRELLERGGAAAGALTLARVPIARAAPGAFDGTIRLATNGLDVGLAPSVAVRAEKDLGFRLHAEYVLTQDAMNRMVREQPAAFDILSGFNFLVDPYWPTRNLQAVDIAKIGRWKEISPLLRLGKVRPGIRAARPARETLPSASSTSIPSAPAGGRAPRGPHLGWKVSVVEWADAKSGLPVGT